MLQKRARYFHNQHNKNIFHAPKHNIILIMKGVNRMENRENAVVSFYVYNMLRNIPSIINHKEKHRN